MKLHRKARPNKNALAFLNACTPAELRAIDQDLARLQVALRSALAEGGHGEHCLRVDYSRPFFGPRHCDCWMAQAEAALGETAERRGP